MQSTFGRRGATIAALLTVALLWSGLAGPCLAGTAPNSASDAAETKQPIDLNRASAEELSTIPGIGKTLAQRIVDFRDEHGPFSRVEDVMKVKGIGEKSFQKIRPYLKVAKKR
jgi:competence protein ComEA